MTSAEPTRVFSGFPIPRTNRIGFSSPEKNLTNTACVLSTIAGKCKSSVDVEEGCVRSSLAGETKTPAWGFGFLEIDH